MKMPALLSSPLCLALLLAAGSLHAAEPDTTVLTGARVIDGTGRLPIENATLFIKGDRIVSIEARKSR